ncbi:MAG: hypothetical protein J6A53_09390 [Clostridia bacterium]|nr:hypothetical protein [Clostridia bacterium]
MKKYLNPEYTNVVVVAEDIVTASIWSNDVTPAGANYKITANYKVDENKQIIKDEDPTATVYGDLTTLIGNSNLGI